MIQNNNTNFDAILKRAGYLALSGALIMLTGAVCWGMTGADLFTALQDHTIQSFLEKAALSKPLYVANTFCWITGVLLLGLAGIIMVSFESQKLSSKIATQLFRTGVPLAIVSFLCMLSVILNIAPDTSDYAIVIATTVGWLGAIGDDLATIMIAGAGPFYISKAVYNTWAPGWLYKWGMIAGVVALFYVVSLLIPSLYSYSFVMVPVGIGWMIAAGITLIRRN